MSTNVTHTNAPSTNTDEDPPADETLRSVRADIDAMHAIIRALVPLARAERRDEAIALASEGIQRFADASYYAHRIERILAGYREEA